MVRDVDMHGSSIKAGLARRRDANVTAVVEGRPQDVRQPGRPRILANVEAALRQRLVAGEGIVRIAKTERCGVSVAQQVKADMLSS